MGGILGNIGQAAKDAGQFALNAANPTLAVIAQHQRAAAEARQQEIAQQILQIKMQREGEEQAARIRYLNAGADQRASEPLQYKQDATGQWYALPSRQGGVGGSAARPSEPDQQPGQSADQQPPPSPRGVMIGQPTGIIGPTRPAPVPRSASAVVNGRTVLGHVNQSGAWAPDTTAQGDTVYGRPVVANGRGAPDTQLNHTINNVRAQIAETQTQLNAAKKAVAAASGVLATPEQKAAAASSNVQALSLQQRLDSLSKVHDVLNARQQSGLGLTPTPTQPATSPPARGASGTLPPDQVRAMQAEFDDASHNLQIVLNASTATPAEKAQARQLYDQRQHAIARKYSHAPTP